MLSVAALASQSVTVTPLSWEEAYTGATALVTQMTLDEKAAM